MSPDQIEALRSTYALIGDGTELSGEFYEQLFAARPDLRSMFPADMDAQRRKFIDSLTEIVTTVDRFDDFEAGVEALGSVHRLEYGVRAEHFPPVRDALLGALHAVLGDGFTEPAAQAWTAAFDLVAETMMQGAGRVTGRDGSTS